MAKKKPISSKNNPAATIHATHTLLLMEVEAIQKRLNQDLGEVKDRIRCLLLPQEPRPQKKTSKEYKKFLDGKGEL